jgi:hypothetical protein
MVISNAASTAARTDPLPLSQRAGRGDVRNVFAVVEARARLTGIIQPVAPTIH